MKSIIVLPGVTNRVTSFLSLKAFALSLSMLFLVAGNTALANNNNPINERAKESFKKEFVNAQAVHWNESNGYSKASFILGGHRAEAYFNAEGELQGCVRDLFFDQLPLSVMAPVDKRFPNADIIEVREITNAEGTSYQVSLEFGSRKYRVGISASGYITNVEKEKKARTIAVK